MAKLKIQLLCNNSSTCEELIAILHSLNYEVNYSVSPESLFFNLAISKIDLVFTDIQLLPKEKIQQFENEIAEIHNIPIIYFLDNKNVKDLQDLERYQNKLFIDSIIKSKVRKITLKALGLETNGKFDDYFTNKPLLFTEIINSSLLPIFIHDFNGNIIFTNEAFGNLIKYKKEELIGKNLSICTDPQHITLLEQINNAISEKGYWEGEILNKTKDGEKKLFSIKSIPLYGDSEIPVAIVTSAKDITITKGLEEESNKFKLAIQHSHEIIFMTNSEGKINYINPQFERFYKYKNGEILGKTPKMLKSGRKPDEFYREFWNNLLEGNNLNIEFENITKDGEIVNVDESISAYFDENNKIAGFISIQRDISEKKQNEEILRRALDKAEESDNLKAAFLNQMSHEIRTPLNSILGFMSLMEEELINRGIKDLAVYFDSVNRSALRLQRTIENILAMSNIQVGNYFTSFTKIDLESVLGLILDDFKSLADEKGIEIIFKNLSESPTILADSYTVIQSFQHLIDNAFKFTNQGIIEVCIYNTDETVCVDIKDTGIGISKEYMEKLFKPFSQEEVGYGRTYDGNGLGLALAKEYLRLNYANISVESEKGKGSIFTIVFYRLKDED